MIKLYKSNRVMSIPFLKTDVFCLTRIHIGLENADIELLHSGKCCYFIYILLSVSFKLTKKSNKYNLKKYYAHIARKTSHGESASRRVADSCTDISPRQTISVKIEYHRVNNVLFISKTNDFHPSNCRILSIYKFETRLE